MAVSPSKRGKRNKKNVDISSLKTRVVKNKLINDCHLLEFQEHC